MTNVPDSITAWLSGCCIFSAGAAALVLLQVQATQLKPPKQPIQRLLAALFCKAKNSMRILAHTIRVVCKEEDFPEQRHELLSAVAVCSGSYPSRPAGDDGVVRRRHPVQVGVDGPDYSTLRAVPLAGAATARGALTRASAAGALTAPFPAPSP